MFFLFTFKKKEEKNFADFMKKIADFQEFDFFTKLKTFKTHFLKVFIIHKPSMGSREIPQKKLGLMGSAVLAFIGYQ